ncbi:MAG: 30S ribosomal protein S12 methylthiotransferase RimO [Lachnospiraceae bacterium]|nr:30S ribosomal protein S12 methylthiotransferase RimO [Lachnospiraceae bacterium]
MNDVLKVHFISLGCDKNLADSEYMLGVLRLRGYAFTDDANEADAVVINTCSFILDAKEESINTILEMVELKKAGRLKAIVVAGCLAQRYRDEMKDEIPEVDGLVGVTATESIADALDRALRGQKPAFFNDISAPMPQYEGKRVLTTGGHYAYLKIAEGCDKHCTYCAIPRIRGQYRSVPMEELLKQAEDLAKSGVKELILVAQETTVYGKDLYGKKCLPALLRKLCKIPGFYWIRILYCYPEEITDELIEVIHDEPKICHYLDMPVQHASDSVLARMGRRTNETELRGRIASLRARIPDICLRTSLITGFPGETQEDFEELYRFVNDIEFDRLGVFTYSREEDTAAYDMPDQIEEEVKEFRRDEIMTLQQEIISESGAAMAGRVMDAMVEGKLADEDVYIARTYRDAPNVDGFVFIHTHASLMTGDFVKVKVTGSNDYDLIGEIFDEYSE